MSQFRSLTPSLTASPDMKTHWNHLRASLIATLCSLDVAGADQTWQSWIDGLDDDQALKLRGCLIQTFGRPDLEEPPHDSKAYAQIYLSNLEGEFSAWLRRPREVIDYVLAARHAGLHVSENPWHWLPAHQELWRFRGSPADVVPPGIRLLQLAESSLERVVSRRLGASLGAFFRGLAERPGEAEEWIVYVDSGCAYFGQPTTHLLGDSIITFEALRNLRPRTQSAPHPSCRDALKDLEQLKAHMPDSLREAYRASLDGLQHALGTYRPKAPVVRPARKRYSHIWDEHSHFLNNWD